jgi:DNA topoisomerase-1
VETSKGKLSRYTFQASGSVVIFDGFTRVYVEVRDESGEEERRDGVLPPLVKDEVLRLISIEPRQHFTQPPPRFSEASLIRELEDNGIGRPSTYAPTLSTIQEREYVNKEKKQFVPTELGLLVTDLLVKSFPQILDAKFTAHLEEELDKVEEGNLSWLKVVKEFYGPFRELLDKANIEMKDVKREEIPTDMKCEKCRKAMVIKWGKRGQFLACSGYPECKNTKDFVMREDGTIKILEAEETGERCPTCGKPMIVKTGRFGRFLACSSYPDCKTVKPISTGVKCPMEGCNGELVERRSKRGKVFYSCSNYPQCKFATWEKPLGERCPMCDYPILLERHKKNGEVVKSCPNKVCGFKEETE